MSKRVYSILIIVALGLGFYLYGIRETQTNVFLIISSGLIFTFLSMGIHGLGIPVLLVRVFHIAHILSGLYAGLGM